MEKKCILQMSLIVVIIATFFMVKNNQPIEEKSPTDMIERDILVESNQETLEDKELAKIYNDICRQAAEEKKAGAKKATAKPAKKATVTKEVSKPKTVVPITTMTPVSRPIVKSLDQRNQEEQLERLNNNLEQLNKNLARK